MLTFLFTDIEGSTRLWEASPEAMAEAHERHWRLIESAVRANGGRVVRGRGEGDSTFTVFDDPLCAVRAALAFQTAMAREEWPTSTPIRVRAAIHLGPAEFYEGDYNSAAVSRCARLRSLAFGGQTLVSEAIFNAVRDQLPDQAGLSDLGSHRLKDLQRPEKVYQLTHPDLPANFPSPRSLDSLPTNLPQQLTTFVGREREMDEVCGLIRAGRLLTLTGEGGCGKTRLALQAGAALLDNYPDGVWLAELAHVVDPELVPQIAATALGLREEPARTLTQTLINYLRERSLLLLLDNCEHLVQGAADLANGLLRECPSLAILATSQNALRVPGERPWRVPSLSLPESQGEEDEPAAPVSCAEALRYEAVALFLERAAEVSPGFRLTPQTLPHVLRIARRLDGIPLALELAAARVNTLSVKKIAARLDDRFRLLTGGIRTALPRQQTLRALVDWSYALLSPEERTLMKRLSIFAGGWTLEAAEAVCADGPRRPGAGSGFAEDSGGKPSGAGGEEPPASDAPAFVPQWQVVDLLGSLVERSLVVAGGGESGPDRYRLLETLRDYALERLAETGEHAVLRLRHRGYFAGLAEEEGERLTGPDQAAALDRLRAEHGNIRAMLDACRSSEGGAELGLHVASSIWRFWLTRGFFREGRDWLTIFLNSSATGDDSLPRIRALNGAGRLASVQGDYPAARELLQEAISLAGRVGDTAGLSASLLHLGVTEASVGEFAAARPLFEQSLEIQRRSGDRRGIAMSVNNLANVLTYQEDWVGARPLLEEAEALCRELGDSQGVAMALNNLGHVALHSDDYPKARRYFTEALGTLRQLGFKSAIADCMEELAKLAALEQEPERSCRLFAAAESLRIAIKVPVPPGEKPYYDRHLASVRATLAEGAFQTEWEAGSVMSLDQAVDFALSIR